ncbi:mask [Symbiodinium natans]|uniref:Mask protein n=1 Tax=Symbiodinium natans TaxID=878477 RepID=A0A812MM20_9DINO|nr:mask [Symbiodinium natans]
MLHVWQFSGQALAVVPIEDVSDVRTLKQHLQSLCGLPRFRQRLLCNGTCLDDHVSLPSPMHLQHVALPFSSVSQLEIEELKAAAESGDLDQVEDMLQKGQDPDLIALEDHTPPPQPTPHTPLALASRAGHDEIAELLLEASADPDKTSGMGGADLTHGVTPLGLACEAGCLEVARLLLDSRAELEKSSGKYQRRPLATASHAGHVPVARFLLQARADMEGTCGLSPPPLAAAFGRQGRRAFGHVHMVRFLLEARADANRTFGPNSDTPLGLAVGICHMGIATLLLQGRADMEQKFGSHGHTPLGLASRAGHHEMVRLLLEAGADISHESSRSRSRPLALACSQGNDYVAKLLLEARAEMSDTLLGEASEKCHTLVVPLLLSYRANPNHQLGRASDSPLGAACRQGHGLDIVHMLLDARADKDARFRPQGDTALGVAARDGRLRVVHILLEARADVTKRFGLSDETPLSAAKQGRTKDHQAIVRLLTEMQP